MSEFKQKLSMILEERSLPVFDVLIENLKKQSAPVVIFGTKRFGKRMLDVLEKHNVTVSCFCDNYSKLEDEPERRSLHNRVPCAPGLTENERGGQRDVCIDV